MGRGVSSGGGQSSLGYLFGSGEASPKPAVNNAPVEAPPTPSSSSTEKGPAGLNSNSANTYRRVDGQKSQNTGNFLTDRPSTRVHSTPGGGSSLDYLFGGGGH